MIDYWKHKQMLSQQEFIDWHNNQKWKPIAEDILIEFYQDWLANHQKIIDMIGGTTIFLPMIEFSKINEIAKDFYNKISKLVYIGVSLDCLANEEIIIGNGRTQSVSKFILNKAINAEVSSAKLAQINNLLSEFGNKIKLAKSQIEHASNLHLRISCDPRSFLMMGNHSGGCFSHNSFNANKKYMYAASPNTFMINLVSRKDNEQNWKSSCDVRAIGLVCDCGIIIINNKLNTVTIQHKYIVEKLIELFGKSLVAGPSDKEKPTLVYYDTRIQFDGGVNYHDSTACIWPNQNFPKKIIWPNKYVKKIYMLSGDSYGDVKNDYPSLIIE